MAVILTDILSAERLAALQAALVGADWQDGKTTAGPQSASVKANQQLAPADPAAKAWAAEISAALARHQGFTAAALPHRMTAPMFNRYAPGNQYGTHIDNAVRTEGRERLRSDLAATLFLADPASYDGGELIVETGFGAPAVKLPAEQMLLYPATCRHRVAPVTRGVRLAAVFWVQSMVRGDAERTLLLDLDRSLQALMLELGPNHAQLLPLTAVYHNLLQRWAEV